MANVTDFGQLRFVMRGPWSSSTSYEFNDVVSYSNSVYCYTKASASSGALPTDTGTWSLMVQGQSPATISALAANTALGLDFLLMGA